MAVLNEEVIQVVWSVDGVIQTDKIEHIMHNGANRISRFYMDQAGNSATKWIYVYPDDYRLHNHHDMYFWSITIDSQKKVLQVLRDKLIEYENDPGWLKIRENYRKRQLSLKKFKEETK